MSILSILRDYQQSITRRRFAAGSYVDGRHVPGSPTETTIIAAVQPTSGEDLLTLPEGQRGASFFKVYTDDPLLLADDSSGRRADVLIIDGVEFEVKQVSVYGIGIYKHSRAMITRLNQ